MKIIMRKKVEITLTSEEVEAILETHIDKLMADEGYILVNSDRVEGFPNVRYIGEMKE